MQTRESIPDSTVNVLESKGDSAKLVSLLALAAGAIAMPQASNADILYTDLSSNPGHVGFAGGYGSSFYLTELPAPVSFGFRTQGHTAYTYYGIGGSKEYRTVTAGRVGGSASAGLQANGSGFVVPLNKNAPWNQPFSLFVNAVVGMASTSGRSPLASYDHKYLAFAFQNPLQGGALRFGWIELSLQIANIFGGGTGPNVTIWGYAYANDGTRPNMGQVPVPEPSSTTLLAFGALVLGARGLRSWRRNRSASEPHS